MADTAGKGAGSESTQDNNAQQKASPGASAGKQPQEGRQSATEMLRNDHREAENFFKKYEESGADKAEIIQTVVTRLSIHTMLEEEIFYPACREGGVEDDMLCEAQVEHDAAKLLMADLLSSADDDPFRDAKVRVLAEQIKHHVSEEEKSREGIFAKATAAKVDTAELAERIRQRREELANREFVPPGRPVAFRNPPRQPASNYQEYDMAHNQAMRDRDDQGRFSSGRGGSRYRDDDDRGGSRGNYRNRDEEGRFTSSRGGNGGGQSGRYDDDRSRSRPSGRYDDDGGRGRGGWFGDSEGHSEASRRGWDNPDHGPSGWYGDSRGHSEASRRGWDNPDHGPSGWYGDSREHSEASRRGWENSDHGRSGWFGDPEGHSEASRRGWDNRGRGYDDDRQGSRGSRGRDDDDRRYSRSGRSSRDDDDDRGQGGWFGDSEGHSEASRRGWEHRR